MTLPRTTRGCFSCHRLRTLAVASAGLLIPFACRDSTAPTLTGGEAARSTSAITPISVRPDSMRGWVFSDDQRNAACTDTSVCSMVDGPAGTMSGTGSVELATVASTDGKALVLPGLGGTRLDRITDLRYTTYRQSVDAGNNLAIALQLNVDYDLNDASTGWQGRIVFEPYHGAGGGVPQATWQTWDTRAGKWWGTKSSVPRNGAIVANPCVQSTPCTWTQLLVTFPNAGVHVTYGAVVLKAGSGWVGFRGNVDALTIAVDGVATTYDFERTATPGYRLETISEDGVVASSWNADTTYAAGAQVTYSFASRPGRAEPIVVLDDTLVSASGRILMNRDRKLEVFSDTVFTYETLQPLERTIADMERQLLTGSDKAGTQEALVRFFIGQLASGVDAEVLSHSMKVARYVVADPIRDSTAIRETDEALANHDFYIDIYDDESYPFDIYHMAPGDYGPIFPVNALVSAGGASASRTTLGQGGISSPAGRFMRIQGKGARASGELPASVGQVRDSRRSPSTMSTGALIPVPRRSGASDDMGNPPEYTQVLYSNGILTDRASAAYDAALVAVRLRKEARFRNWYASVASHYNRTQTVENKQLTSSNPCEARAEVESSVLSQASVWFLWSQCKASLGSTALTKNDLAEAIRMRWQILTYSGPTTPDVLALTELIARYRNYWHKHVILVGHSQGAIVGAQAIQGLPGLEHHPVNVADRCVAALALAPAVAKADYGLDENHVTGLLANGDIIANFASTEGWRRFEVPLSYKTRRFSNVPALSAVAQIYWGVEVHYVENSYLVNPGLDLMVEEISKLHRECLPSQVTLTLSTPIASVGSELTANVTVYNQNNRELHGRLVGIGGGPVIQQGYTNTLTAFYPKDAPQQVVAGVTDLIKGYASLTVPIPSIDLTVGTVFRSRWSVWAAMNGPDGSSDLAPPPTQPPSSCPQVVHFDAASGGWIEYKAICETAYQLVYDRPAALPGGLEIADVRETLTTAPGEAGTKRSGDSCLDSALCMASAQVEFLSWKHEVIARSEVKALGGGGPSYTRASPGALP